jgi:hypothetical protein
MSRLEELLASASDDEELLLDQLTVELPTEDAADADARSTGAVAASRRGACAPDWTVGVADEVCWAHVPETVPAIRKLKAAARRAMRRKLQFVCIV